MQKLFRHQGSGAPVVEALEGRRFMCGGPLSDVPAVAAATLAPAADGDPADVTPPAVVGIRIEGTPRETTAVVLTFSEPLDPARAQRTSNYQISRKQNDCDDDGGGVIDNPFGGDDDDCDDERQRVRIDDAVYDDAARTVTLVPHAPFRGDRRMRRVRVNADANTGVADAAGNRLDGDRDGTPGGRATIKLRVQDGGSASYKEGDGDRVKLKLRGPGTLGVLREVDRNGKTVGGAIQVFVTGGKVTASTVLDGTVKKSSRGDGIATVGEVVNPSGATIAIADNPAFSIGDAPAM